MAPDLGSLSRRHQATIQWVPYRINDVFFKSKPNLRDAEKARIEFHLQQIAECIGFDRFKLPVLSSEKLLSWFQAKQTPEQMIATLGQHLSHDVGGIKFVVSAQPIEKCGSGGG